MPNRFYQNQGQGLDLNRVLGPIATIKGWEDTAADLALKKQALEETTRQHGVSAGIQQGNLDVNRGQLAVQQATQQIAENKEDPRLKTWDMGHFGRVVTGLKLQGYPTEALSFLNDLKPLAEDKNMKKGDIAVAVEQNWPEWSARSDEDIFQHTVKLADQARKLPENDPKRIEIMKQMDKAFELRDKISEIPQERIKDLLFPDIAQFEAETRATTSAASAAARAEMAKPDIQFMMARKIQLMDSGMDEASATVQTYKERNELEAAKLRAGRSVTNFGGGLPTNVPQGEPGKANTGALQGLSKVQQDTVKAIAEYRFPVTNLRNKEMMALVQRAYAYDPTFDAKEYAVRSGVRKDFTAGNASKSILSLNTAVGHLESLAKAGEELKNSPIQVWNKIANYGLTATGDPRVTKFNTTATAVSGELATVFKSTSGTDQEIKAWRENLSAAQSPEQIKTGGVDQAVELIGSRLVALANKYEQGMGRKMDFQILSNKSRAILKRLGVDISKYEGATPTTAELTPTRREGDVKRPLSAY